MTFFTFEYKPFFINVKLFYCSNGAKKNILQTMGMGSASKIV